MKHIGHTLFNDDRYGGKKILKGIESAKYKQFIENCFEMIPGQALHAATLGFIHPTTEKELFFEAAPPEGFKLLIEKWRNYSKSILKV
jgi:23S rRNA pseudouridine1911/1915/1917 synthase